MKQVISRRHPVAPGVELAVDVWDGEGRGMVLVHGLASNARLWDGTAEHLWQLGHAVATLDQRGHGRSDKPETGYDLGTVCTDVAAVIEGLGGIGPWDRPLVVGQSWGANVALELAYRRPDLVSAIACVDGGTIELAQRFESWDECVKALEPPRLAGIKRDDLEAGLRAMHPGWPESGIQGTLANFEVRTDGTAAPWLSLDHHLAILRSLWEHRPSQRYPNIQVPVLLVPADTGDAPWTGDKRSSTDAALAAIPNVRVHWFSPADHDIHAQFPVELGDLLHEFVGEEVRS